jgi:hypothetical protein
MSLGVQVLKQKRRFEKIGCNVVQNGLDLIINDKYKLYVNGYWEDLETHKREIGTTDLFNKLSRELS